jgi:RNA recognition motif-containing protein
LREHFSAVAAPSQVVMPVDRETGRPRGFAFVDFADRPVAEEVIRKFDGQPFKGRSLAISEARGREERGPMTRPSPGAPPPRFDGSVPSAPRPAGRNFGPDARPKGARPLKRKPDQKPKGPIKERPVSRLFDVDDEEPADLTDFDDPASSAADVEAEEDES